MAVTDQKWTMGEIAGGLVIIVVALILLTALWSFILFIAKISIFLAIGGLFLWGYQSLKSRD